MKFFLSGARKLPAPYLLLLCSFGFALGLGGFFYANYRPSATRLAALHLEELQRERSLALSARLLAEHPSVLDRLHTNDAATQSRLGASDPAVELLTRDARAHRLDLDLVEPGSVLKVGNQRITPISLHVSGEYGDFLAWLRDLETSNVLVTVDQISMEGSPTGRHLFRVSLSTYAFSTKG